MLTRISSESSEPLVGKRFLTMIQSNDPHMQYGKLGGRAPVWNWREWLHKDRGL
jgi:hypothetical protein